MFAVVIAMWAVAAVIGIPKISQYIADRNNAASTSLAPAATPTAGSAGTGGGSPSGGTGAATTGSSSSGSPRTSGTGQSGSGSGSGKAGGGSGGGGNSGGNGNGGTSGGSGGGNSGGANGNGNSGGNSAANPGANGNTGGTAPGGAAGANALGNDSASGAQLTGTILGPDIKGVQLSLEPASLVEAADQNAQPAPGTDARTSQGLRAMEGALGKIPREALQLVSAGTNPNQGVRSTVSGDDGSFGFAGITSPGYYLLIAARAGFETQRYIVNAATLAGGLPMNLTMQPGEGKLSGKVTSGGQPVGAASVSITDGTVSLQTSSVSKQLAGAKLGSWTVDGLSTPGTYLVTVTAPGLGAESRLVTLKAGGASTADLTLLPGVSAITGTVTGRDALGRLGGLGGVTVTATGTVGGVHVTRSATTVTTGPVGAYTLPDLPNPGSYTVTVTADGYASQTRTVDLAAGASSAVVDLSLSQAAGVVVGTVTGTDAAGRGLGGLVGVGLTLSGTQATFKTMSTSSPAGGYQFTGVPPGTYVLTGSQFGRETSSVTVVVVAAQTIRANLNLATGSQNELPTTSHIRGQVVDARTQGKIDCDRAVEDHPNCQLTATVTAVTDTSGNTTKTSTLTTTVPPGEEYVLPSLSDTAHHGIAPGLYTVTLSAPGYENNSVLVQVPQGQTVEAPQVALEPLGIISGTVSAKIGTPDGPSCVVSVPNGVGVPAGCRITTAGGVSTCTATGAGVRCAVTGADGSYLIRGLLHGAYQLEVIPTDPEYRTTKPLQIQLQLADDYRFDPALDRMGRVTVQVLSPDQKTLALSDVPGAQVTATNAATGQRAGTPLGGAARTGADGTITLTRLTGTFTLNAGKTGLGSAQLTGVTVADNQVVTETLVLTQSIGAVVGHVATSIDGAAVDVAGAKVTITGVVGFAGRSPVTGTVTVTTDANGCYAIIPVGWNLATDPKLAGGDCAGVAPGSVGKMTVSGTTTPASLVALPISVNVVDSRVQSFTATGVLITGTGRVKVIPPSLVTANPSAAAGLTLTLRAPRTSTVAENPAQTVFTVSRKPAAAGSVTVQSNAGSPSFDGDVAVVTGSLTFADSLLAPRTNVLVPGRYTITATQVGYQTTTVDLWCGFAENCTLATFDATGKLLSTHDKVAETATVDPSLSFVQRQLPSLNGVLYASQNTAGSDYATNWPVRSATFTAVGPAAAGSLAITVTTQSDPTLGAVAVADRSLPEDNQNHTGLVQPGTYTFTVALNGYLTTPSFSVECAANFETRTSHNFVGCDPLTTDSSPSANSRINLIPLPRWDGSLQAQPTNGSTGDLTGVTIGVTGPIPSQLPALTVDNPSQPTSTLSWKDGIHPDGRVVPGTYTLSFAKFGYDQVTVTFSCAAGTTTVAAVCQPANGQPIALTMLPRGGGTVQVDQTLPDGTVDWDQLTVSFSQVPSGVSGLRVVAVNPSGTSAGLRWTDPTLLAGGFDQIIQRGTYVFTVALPGYGTSAPVTMNCPARVTVCAPPTIQLGRLPLVSGTVKTIATLTPDPSTGVSGVQVTSTNQPYPNQPVTLSINPTAGDPTTGELVFHQTGEPDRVALPGTYNLFFSDNGYQSESRLLTCTGTGCAMTCPTDPTLAGTCDPATPSTIELRMNPAPGGSVVLTQSLPNGQDPWSEATVTVTSQPGTAAGLSVSVKGIDAQHASLVWTPPAPGFAGTVPPGNYLFTVAVPGYSSGPVTMACSITTGCAMTCSAGCSGNVITLNPLPAFRGQVTDMLVPAAGQPNVPVAAASLTGTVSVSVVSGPNLAAPPTITVAPDGTMSWQDGTLPANVAQPGTYRLQLSQPGFVSTTVTVDCSSTAGTPAGTCAFSASDTNGFTQDADGTLELKVFQTPIGDGTVEFDHWDGQTAIPWSQATVTFTKRPAAAASAVITLVADSAKSTATTAVADLVWRDSNFPNPPYATGTTAPTDTSPYSITVSVPGFGAVASGDFTCDPGTRCQPDAPLSLTAQPAFTGSVTASPTIADPSTVTVTVSSGSDVDKVTASVTGSSVTSTSSGNIAWHQGSAPLGAVEYSGTPYTITASAPGYLGGSVSFTCTKASCTMPGAILLYQNGNLVVDVKDDAGDPVNGATVTFSGTNTATTTVTAPANGNELTFPNVAPSSVKVSYEAVVQAAGYAKFDTAAPPAPEDISCTSTQNSATPTPFQVLSGGTTYCTLTITKLGVLTGQVLGVTPLTGGGTSSSPLVGASIKVTQGKVSFTATSGANGAFTITGTASQPGLAAGTWSLTATFGGFDAGGGTFTVLPDYSIQEVDPDNDGNPPAGKILVNADGQATVTLAVQTVDFQLQMLVNNTQALLPSTISMSGNNGKYTCQLTTNTDPTKDTCSGAGDAGQVVVGGGAKKDQNYIDFPTVVPGTYVVSVSSATNAFRQYNVQYIVLPGVSPQVLAINLSSSSSSQAGTVQDAQGNLLNGAYVGLRTANNVAVKAVDTSGKALDATTANLTLPGGQKSNGAYQFTNVPDGTYQLVVSYPGYAPVIRTGVTFDSGNPNNNGLIAPVQLTTRATNQVVVQVHSDASTPGEPTAALEQTSLGTGPSGHHHRFAGRRGADPAHGQGRHRGRRGGRYVPPARNGQLGRFPAEHDASPVRLLHRRRPGGAQLCRLRHLVTDHRDRTDHRRHPETANRFRRPERIIDHHLLHLADNTVFRRSRDRLAVSHVDQGQEWQRPRRDHDALAAGHHQERRFDGVDPGVPTPRHLQLGPDRPVRELADAGPRRGDTQRELPRNHHARRDRHPAQTGCGIG